MAKSKKRKKKGASKPRARDTIFFLHTHNPKESDVLEKEMRTEDAISIGGRELKPGTTFWVGVPRKDSGTAYAGTAVPVKHFRPLVRRLIRDKVIDPKKDPGGAIKKIVEITEKLMPKHPRKPPEGYLDEVMRYGEHMSPFVGIKHGVGKCSDRAAIIAAMGRAAGLEVEIRGSPNFYEDCPHEFAKAHAWPVFKVGGKRIPIHMEAELLGPIEDPEEFERERKETRHKVLNMKYGLYHEIPRTYEVPEELKIDRPDLFGEE